MAQKQPFLDTKLAIERARRLQMARNLFGVMRLCFPVVMSYLDAGFEPRCGRKDFWTACCCCLLLLLKRVGHPWTLKGGVKPQQGKPSLVNISTRVQGSPGGLGVGCRDPPPYFEVRKHKKTCFRSEMEGYLWVLAPIKV